MPCRALEAFRLVMVGNSVQRVQYGLNALSGIGGVQTPSSGWRQSRGRFRLNALSGIGGVQTVIMGDYNAQIISAS